MVWEQPPSASLSRLGEQKQQSPLVRLSCSHSAFVTFGDLNEELGKKLEAELKPSAIFATS